MRQSASVPAGDPTHYVPTKVAERWLGVRRVALYRWARSGWIEHYVTPGGHYRWDVEGYLRRKTAVIKPDKTAPHTAG